MVDIRIGEDVIRDVNLMIFDKDGTLMELYHYWSQMVAMRAKIIAERLNLNDVFIDGLMYEMGVDAKAERLRQDGPVGLKKREIVMQAAMDYLERNGYKDTYRLCHEVFAEVDNLSLTMFGKLLKPINGALPLLDALHKKGCRVAIATTDRGERARLAMDFLGFGDKIDIIVGADQVEKPKPNPEIAHIILNNLNIDPLNAVIVGDAETDVLVGINAGLKASIGVLTGFATFEDFKKITPFVAEDVSKIGILG
ncbi:MAG: HAD family hydrolase [Prolixibacteraceae bacterium]|nr:HAD family hydrolase [Prolixibacteraceae bacterium]